MSYTVRDSEGNIKFSVPSKIALDVIHKDTDGAWDSVKYKGNDHRTQRFELTKFATIQMSIAGDVINLYFCEGDTLNGDV